MSREKPHFAVKNEACHPSGLSEMMISDMTTKNEDGQLDHFPIILSEEWCLVLTFKKILEFFHRIFSSEQQPFSVDWEEIKVFLFCVSLNLFWIAAKKGFDDPELTPKSFTNMSHNQLNDVMTKSEPHLLSFEMAL